MKPIDKSVEADAKRMRWLLNGRWNFMEEHLSCPYRDCSEEEQDEVRIAIDEAMSWYDIDARNN